MKYTTFIAIALLFPVLSFAQHDATTKNQAQTEWQHSDEMFLKKALEGGLNEIMSGSLAKTNSTNKDIIAYGRMMEQDHQAVNEKLKNIARQKNLQIPDRLPDEAQKSYEKLRELKGAEFDKAFTMQMIADHKKAIELFTQQAQNGSDAELRNLANESLPKLQQHLHHIEQLSEQKNR